MGCGFNIIFHFPGLFSAFSISPFVPPKGSGLHYSYSKPLLWFHKGVPHLLSTGVISDFTHKLGSSFSLPPASLWLFPQSVSQAPFLDPLPTLVFLLPSSHISCNYICLRGEVMRGKEENLTVSPHFLDYRSPFFSLFGQRDIIIQY